MNFQIILGLLLTVLPVVELRGGLPVIVDYVLREGVSIWPYFVLVLILNVLVIYLIFLFLDFLHEGLMKWGFYRRRFEKILQKIQKKVRRVDSKMGGADYFALMLLVAVPLPGTGAWTGTLIAWVLGLNRLKSFIAIALGVIIAGALVLLASLGLFSVIY